MHASVFSVAIVAPVMALAATGFQFPDAVPLDKRQTSGPKFECHSACGNAILDSQSNANYCDSAEWVGLLDDCLDCALEFEIWQYYSPQVKPAAEKCGLDATPKPAGAGGATSAAAQSSTQAAASETASATAAVSEASSIVASSAASASAAASTQAGQSQAPAIQTTLSTAEVKPEATSHAGQATSQVTPPASSQTPVTAGAGAVGLSQIVVGAAAIVGVMAAF